MPTQWGFAVAAFLMMLSLGLLYQLSRQNKWYARPVLLLMKGGTTAIASLLALAGALLWPTPYAGWLAAGLLLCALADVLLELRFPLGMLAFALGHLCYIAALLQMGSFTALHGLLFGLIALAGLIAMVKLRKKLSQPVYFVYPYMLVIGLMLSLAADKRLPMALGALFFAISDGLILARLAGAGRGKAQDNAVMLLYYLGQFLIALNALPRLLA